MNKIILIGRLTKEPELKYTTSNVAVCQLSLAVTRNFKNANGEYDADFINCISYNKQAETLGEYLRKGDRIGVEGRLNTRSYTNKEDKKVYVTEVIIESFDFLTPKKDKEEVKKNNDPFNDISGSITTDDLDEIELPFD